VAVQKKRRDLGFYILMVYCKSKWRTSDTIKPLSALDLCPLQTWDAVPVQKKRRDLCFYILMVYCKSKWMTPDTMPMVNVSVLESNGVFTGRLWLGAEGNVGPCGRKF
jgi:hypothetical protein